MPTASGRIVDQSVRSCPECGGYIDHLFFDRDEGKVLDRRIVCIDGHEYRVDAVLHGDDGLFVYVNPHRIEA